MSSYCVNGLSLVVAKCVLWQVVLLEAIQRSRPKASQTTAAAKQRPKMRAPQPPFLLSTGREISRILRKVGTG